jgi:hypothetical protein
MTPEQLVTLINQSKGGASAPALAPEAGFAPGPNARPAKTVQEIAERSKNNRLTNTNNSLRVISAG